ncbi:hypothetical protein M3J09_008738 [Ascochyta lentis]
MIDVGGAGAVRQPHPPSQMVAPPFLPDTPAWLCNSFAQNADWLTTPCLSAPHFLHPFPCAQTLHSVTELTVART